MTEKETNEKNIIIEQLRWLIDQKQDFLKSLESRIIQILGINGIFLAILWGAISGGINFHITEITILGLYFISIGLQIAIFFVIGRPREAEIQLEVKNSISNIKDNMEKYFREISLHLRKRAQITVWVYRIFICQITIFLLLVFLRINSLMNA